MIDWFEIVIPAKAGIQRDAYLPCHWISALPLGTQSAAGMTTWGRSVFFKDDRGAD